MKTLVVFCMAVAAATAIQPSGWVGVGKNGAVIAGPAGSIRTDNGLHGHGAGAQLSGPSGDVRTRGGHVQLDGPGKGGWGGEEGGNWGGNGGGNLGGGLGLGNGGNWGHGQVVVTPVLAWGHGGDNWGNGGGWGGNEGGWGKGGW